MYWPGASSGQLVAELMSKDPVAVDSTVDPAAVARLMLDHHLHAVPVVEEGRLAGIVTCRDVLRTITRDDHDIAQDIRSRLCIVCRAAWDVEVNGVVTLTATSAAPADRRAARIVAAARPGVLAVRVVDTSEVDTA
jgi:CBS-domain-containing membrane protein